MAKVDFDDYADNYNNLVSNQLAAFDSDSEYFAEYKALLTRSLVAPSPSQILEYGCGIGRNLGALRKHFPDAELHGCDISEASLDYARRSHADVVLTTVDEVAAGKARFDLVFIAGVLHHVPPADRAAFMESVRSTLKTGGDVVIFEHNPLNPVTRHLVNTCPFDEDAVLLRPRETRGLLQSNRFDVVTKGYALFFPGILKGLRPLEGFIRWLPLGGQYYIHARAS